MTDHSKYQRPDTKGWGQLPPFDSRMSALHRHAQDMYGHRIVIHVFYEDDFLILDVSHEKMALIWKPEGELYLAPGDHRRLWAASAKLYEAFRSMYDGDVNSKDENNQTGFAFDRTLKTTLVKLYDRRKVVESTLPTGLKYLKDAVARNNKEDILFWSRYISDLFDVDEIDYLIAEIEKDKKNG